MLLYLRIFTVKEDEEFLAAESSGKSVDTRYLFQDLAETSQYNVTVVVTIGVVYALEVVNIHHDNLQRIIRTVSLYLLFGHFKEICS